MSVRNRSFVRTLRWIVGAALIIPAVLLLAFGPSASQSLPQDRVIVDYWEKWTGEEGAQMKSIVDLFNKTVGAEKKIFVRYLSTSSVNHKTLVSTAAGVPPDVAGLWDPNVAQFAAMDALEPLDEMAAGYGIKPGFYKDVFWKSCHYDGKLYALISTPYDVALHYNTQLFQENADKLRAAGLDPNRAPRTIAELDAYAVAMDQRDERGRIVRAGYLPLEPGWYLTYTCFWFGGSWWDEKNKRFTFDDPGVIAGYEWIQSYSKRLGPDAVTTFRSGVGTYDSPQNAFFAGTVAMVQQGTFLANVMEHQRPSMKGNWAAAPFPTIRPELKNVTYCNSDVLVIPRGAKHKREAFEFIAFVNRQDVMERLCNLHCKISPLAKVSDEFIAKHRNPFIRVFEDLALSPNAHGTPSVPILPQVVEELNTLVQGLASMSTTPREALPGIQARLQQKYDEFMADQQRRREKRQDN